MKRNNLMGMAAGYYLSRCPNAYDRLGSGTQASTHIALGYALAVPAASIKNWRDEFDPIHENGRCGWRNRPMLPSRERLAECLSGWAEDELHELVVDSMMAPIGPVASRFLAACADLDDDSAVLAR